MDTTVSRKPTPQNHELDFDRIVLIDLNSVTHPSLYVYTGIFIPSKIRSFRNLLPDIVIERSINFYVTSGFIRYLQILPEDSFQVSNFYYNKYHEDL